MDIVPSFYDLRHAGDVPASDFSDWVLRHGEIVRVIYPDDPRSRSRRLIEYDVDAEVRDQGVPVVVRYHNCVVANPLAGFADKLVMTLRVDPRNKNSADPIIDGFGSKVLILCINGEQPAAVIVSGIRDTRDTSDISRKARGHHLEWVFNGAKFEVLDSGAWRLTYGGKTTASGDRDLSRDPGAGTVVEVKKDGTFEVKTTSGVRITVDNSGTVTLQGGQVKLGAAATQPLLMGTVWLGLMTELLTVLSTLAVAPSPLGVITVIPPHVALLQGIAARLQTALSGISKTA